MKSIRITQPVPNDNPETIVRWLFSQIGEMLQRTEWIAQLTEESAKLGVFEEPVWTRDQRRLAKKLRSFYAHDVQRIDRHGTVHFYNKGRKTGPKNTKKTLTHITDDWTKMYHLVHETLVCYMETTLECQTCGSISHGTDLPDCGHCVAPAHSNEKDPVIIKPQNGNLHIKVEYGRADTIDEFINERRKMTLADGAWQMMMETGQLPTNLDRVAIGDNIVPDEHKSRMLRESWPTQSE